MKSKEEIIEEARKEGWKILDNTNLSKYLGEHAKHLINAALNTAARYALDKKRLNNEN